MKDRNTSDLLKERRKIYRKHAQFKHQLEQKRIVGKTYNRLSKGSSVTLKVAEDRSIERNNNICNTFAIN